MVKEQMDGRLEVTGRRGRRHKKLLDDIKETRGYCKLKQKEVHRTVWRTGSGRDDGPTCRKADNRMNECMDLQFCCGAGASLTKDDRVVCQTYA